MGTGGIGYIRAESIPSYAQGIAVFALPGGRPDSEQIR